MTTDASIISDFRKKVCDEIEIEPEGLDRFLVHTPFTFDDGDHFVIVLKRGDDGWLLTDEGHTLMHMSYSGLDLNRTRRAKIIDDSLRYHGVESRDGEFCLDVPEEKFGDSLFSYLQALSKSTNVTQITKEVAKTTFFDDFNALVSEIVPEDRLAFDWSDEGADPKGLYKVDCRIDARRPWFLFAVNGGYKCQNVTIACLTLEKHLAPFRTAVIFEDQTEIPRPALARLTDVIGKQFSSLDDRDRIKRFFNEEILNGH